MVFAILAAVSATVQLGMGAGSAVADYFQIKHRFFNAAEPESSGSWLFFQTFGCSDTQRETYSTVS